MRVFNEEGSKGKPQVVLVLEGTEVLDIVEAMEAGIKAQPRKSKWKSLVLKLGEFAAY